MRAAGRPTRCLRWLCGHTCYRREKSTVVLARPWCYPTWGAAKNAPSKTKRPLRREEGHPQEGKRLLQAPRPAASPWPTGSSPGAPPAACGPSLQQPPPRSGPQGRVRPQRPSPEAGSGGFLSAGTPAGGGLGRAPQEAPRFCGGCSAEARPCLLGLSCRALW